MKKEYLLFMLIGLFGTVKINNASELIDLDVCKGKADGFFANNPTNCQAYWICMKEIGHIGKCEYPFNFNENHQLCDLPENWPCIQCPLNGIHFIGIETSCTQYHFCFQGNHTVRECENGLQFDIAQKTCDRKEKAQCEYRKCPIRDDPRKLITYGSKENCQDYFICYNGKLESYHCNDGIHWNQRTQQCDLPEFANCTANKPVVTCPEDDNIHFIPHPTDCQRYFICSRGEKFPKTCPNHLLFDPKLLTCNTPNAVECKKIVSDIEL